MDINNEMLRKSIRLFMYLLEHKELKNKQDLEMFNSYNEPNVKKNLVIFEEEANCDIVKYDDTIYLIPRTHNEFLGFKKSELKKEIFSRTDMLNVDVYLAMYMIILLTAEFFSGNAANVKIRDSISIDELNLNLTNKLEIFKEEDKKIESGLAVSNIAKRWFSLKDEDDDIVIRSRKWYILQVVKFLEKQSLIRISDDTEVLTTLKFDRLAQNYFLNYDRLDEIQKLFSEVK